jgi:acyl carrier protein
MRSETTSGAALEREVRSFIENNFPLGGDMAALRSDESLLDAGILDSTAVLELVDFIEGRFGIRVSDDDLLPENFDSIAGLVRYVETGLERAAPGQG